MIDASKSPTPAWQRYAVAGLLTVLIVVAGFMLWSKYLHHPSASSTSGATAPAAVSPSAGAGPTTTTTTIPTSNRDPFQP